MRVNVGRAKTDLSKLLARVEAGEEIEIARDWTPVAHRDPFDRLLISQAPTEGIRSSHRR